MQESLSGCWYFRPYRGLLSGRACCGPFCGAYIYWIFHRFKSIKNDEKRFFRFTCSNSSIACSSYGVFYRTFHCHFKEQTIPTILQKASYNVFEMEGQENEPHEIVISSYAPTEQIGNMKKMGIVLDETGRAYSIKTKGYGKVTKKEETITGQREAECQE